MAYDIFISYAHVDDEPQPPAKAGWVTTFVKGLKTKLNQELGRKDAYSLWMDYELRGNQAVTPKIHSTLDEASTLVLFLSPGHLASQWCREELSRFAKRVGTTGGRIFTVWLRPVEEMPEVLADLGQYQFWREDHKGNARTMASPVPDPTDRAYYDLREDLARVLAKTI